ncbi:MAG: tail fiber domain-containing protein [Vicinamibacterales bacterium]
MTRSLTVVAALVLGVLCVPAPARAQSLGTFRWQLQPYCNVITVNIVQQGAVFTADGFDDQCGASQRALLVGTATVNPDGTVGFGLNIVTSPGGRPVQVSARVALGSLAGPWSDSAGNSGTFAFNASTGGNPRPAPSSGSTIPGTFSFLSDGGFAAGGALNVGNIPASGTGTRMMWYPGKAAFRAGYANTLVWDDVNVGRYSAAFGFDTLAAGSRSAAFGESTQALGIKSTAFGFNTAASGENSTAMGFGAAASGLNAFATGSQTQAVGSQSAAFGTQTSATAADSAAFGQLSVASGPGSFAAGRETQADGFYSVAMGLRAVAGAPQSVVLGSDVATIAAATGTFLFGDRSTTTDMVGFAPNQFIVRAAGGTSFYSNATLTAGVSLFPGAGAWSNVSDVNMKEDFRDLDGEDVLSRLARMPVREWRYKAQEAGIRHLGPTAQDFHAAFNLGESDVRISTVDADGVALAAARALEARTARMRDAQSTDRDALAALQRENDELRARLLRLEQLLGVRQ